MVTLRAGNLLGWPSPLVLSGSQDPAGCACIPPGEPPSQNQPNRIGWEGVSEIEAHCLPWIGRSHWPLAWHHSRLGRANDLVK